MYYSQALFPYLGCFVVEQLQNYFSASKFIIEKSSHKYSKISSLHFHNMVHLFLTFSTFHSQYLVYTHVIDSIFNCQFHKPSSKNLDDQAELSCSDFSQ